MRISILCRSHNAGRAADCQTHIKGHYSRHIDRKGFKTLDFFAQYLAGLLREPAVLFHGVKTGVVSAVCLLTAANMDIDS